MRVVPKSIDGLVPVIVQDDRTRQVLMLAYMNQAALDETRRSGLVTFYSRSRARLWKKGETSGNFLELVEMGADCDGDALLARVRPRGPVCHVGDATCFAEAADASFQFLAELQAVVDSRFGAVTDGPPSYTAKLIAGGLDRMAQKVGEEGIETVIAAKNPDREALIGESADLVFHLMVLLRAREVAFSEVVNKLRDRHEDSVAGRSRL